jgi:ATP-binding cassette subfamily E protein 1
MRFRDEELTFKVVENDSEKQAQAKDEKQMSKPTNYKYPAMTKTMKPFSLTVHPGQFQQSEIVVMLGQNGTGKTTLIKMLAGILKPDDQSIEMPRLNVSYKP